MEQPTIIKRHNQKHENWLIAFAANEIAKQNYKKTPKALRNSKMRAMAVFNKFKKK